MDIKSKFHYWTKKEIDRVTSILKKHKEIKQYAFCDTVPEGDGVIAIAFESSLSDKKRFEIMNQIWEAMPSGHRKAFVFDFDEEINFASIVERSL